MSTSSAVDTRTPAEIHAEDNYFDTHYGASDPLDGPQRFWSGMSGHGYRDEDFPSDARDEVFVAHFSTWAAHLSESRLSIYTTINLQIDRVVVDKDRKFKQGSDIPLIVPGGTILAPWTQKAFSYFIRADDFTLLPNTEYLIFLSRQPQLQFYNYIKAWKVDKGILEPAIRFDTFRMSQGRSTYGGKSLESAICYLTAC